MKLKFLLAAMFLITISAHAQDSTSFAVSCSIHVKDHQKLLVTIANPSAEKLTMNIYNSGDGNVVTKPIETGMYRGCLDFSTAVDGDYTLEIAGKKHRTVKTINIRT